MQQHVAFEQVAEIASDARTAIMCSESVFWRCHRRLVSDYAVALGGTVEHIFPNGQSKPHSLTAGALAQCFEGRVQLAYPGEPTLFD